MSLAPFRTAPPAASRFVLGAAAAMAVAVLAGCTGPPAARWNPGAEPTTSTGGSMVDAAEWKPCPEVAEETAGSSVPDDVTFDCATVKVPQDWHEPHSGETFDVALIRARSDYLRDEERIGSLVVNPGGPGASGVNSAVYLSLTLPIEILRQFDIVGFDPRGVGRSSSLECYSDQDKDLSYGSEPDPKSQRAFDKAVDLARDMVDDCERKYGDTLRHFSTEQTARDMEAIRQAVGDEKLTFLGYSYGTLLGAVYAKLFPDKIRAMVLDGAVDPRKNEIEGSKSQAAGFEHAFDNFATWCDDRGEDQCPIGPNARKSVTSLLDEAREDPVPGPDGRKATAGWVLSSVVYTLYVQDWWPRLAQALDDLERGESARMFQIVDMFNERDSDGDYPNSLEMLTTVNCVDEEKSLSVKTVRRLQGQWRDDHPLFGGPLALSMLHCAVFPDLHDPFELDKVEGAPPILVVGTTGDPATPYEQAGDLTELLGSGVLVTYRGEGHTAYPKPGCLNNTVNDYLLEEEAPSSQVTC